jgi:hypothetical protein
MKVDLKELKEKALELKDIEPLFNKIHEFDIFSRTFISMYKNKDLDNSYLSIKLLHSQLYEKQIITERIQSLVHNLSKLKITLITEDYCKARKIIYKYLHQNYTNIKYLISKNKSFKKDLEHLDNAYSEFIKKIEELSNEKYTSEKNKLKRFVKKLNEVQKEQEYLLSHSSVKFLKYSKDIIHKEQTSNCDVDD